MEAVKWYTKAAEQGYADAQFNLAFMYENGRGVAQSDEEAQEWYAMAARLGHADALAQLRYMVASGVAKLGRERRLGSTDGGGGL